MLLLMPEMLHHNSLYSAVMRAAGMRIIQFFALLGKKQMVVETGEAFLDYFHEEICKLKTMNSDIAKRYQKSEP